MKIIDLLNKIANGEEDDLQTEFEFDGEIWNFYKLNHSEYCLDGWLLNQNITITKHKEDELEEKKIPEKIEYYDDSIAWVIDGIGQLSDVDKVIIDKLNDVIDYLKEKENKIC